MPGAQRSTPRPTKLPRTSIAARSGPVPILSRLASSAPAAPSSSSPQSPSSLSDSAGGSSSPSSPTDNGQYGSQYPPEDTTLQQTTTTTPNGGTVTLVNTQPGNGSDILISASESANIVSIHLINGKTLRIVWENAGPALGQSTS